MSNLERLYVYLKENGIYEQFIELLEEGTFNEN